MSEWYSSYISGIIKVMKIVVLAGGPAASFETYIAQCGDFSHTYFVGVDRGAHRLMQAGFPVNLAIGDFDSLKSEEFEAVSAYADELHQSPAEKDDTDLELAMLTVAARFKKIDKILILGGIGGRFDHGIQIFYLVLQKRFADLVEKIRLIDNQNVIQFVGPGRHQVVKDPSMTYLAFASLTPVSNFLIKDAKYELDRTDFDRNFSLSSNEFIDEQPVTISFTAGIVSIIQSKDL